VLAALPGPRDSKPAGTPRAGVGKPDLSSVATTAETAAAKSAVGDADERCARRDEIRAATSPAGAKQLTGPALLLPQRDDRDDEAADPCNAPALPVSYELIVENRQLSIPSEGYRIETLVKARILATPEVANALTGLLHLRLLGGA
jgi:hypothetical protein